MVLRHNINTYYFKQFLSKMQCCKEKHRDQSYQTKIWKSQLRTASTTILKRKQVVWKFANICLIKYFIRSLNFRVMFSKIRVNMLERFLFVTSPINSFTVFDKTVAHICLWGVPNLLPDHRKLLFLPNALSKRGWGKHHSKFSNFSRQWKLLNMCRVVWWGLSYLWYLYGYKIEFCQLLS